MTSLSCSRLRKETANCISIERIHPLEGGYLRLKFRRDRRPGLPLEPAWRFYPKYLVESIWKVAAEKGLYMLVKATGKYWRFDYRYGGKRLTLAGIASALDEMGVQPARDGRWHAATVKRLLERTQAAKRVSSSNRRAKDKTAPQPPSMSPQTTSSEKDDPNWGSWS